MKKGYKQNEEKKCSYSTRSPRNAHPCRGTIANGRRAPASIRVSRLASAVLPSPSNSPDLLPMRTCFMSPSQLRPSLRSRQGTEYREILYACNPSTVEVDVLLWLHLRLRLHSPKSNTYGPLYYTVLWPGLFFLFFF